ncbi:MAG: hypothetical protein AAGA42_03855 [Actinomycetota bacterium]
MSTTPTSRSLDAPARSVWWQLPTALWVYAMLRSLAFAAPAFSEGGRVGLGAVVVALLFVKVVRGSMRAWKVLAWLDVVMLAMLLTAWFAASDAPLSIPALAIAATLTLFMPSIRQHLRAAGT